MNLESVMADFKENGFKIRYSDGWFLLFTVPGSQKLVDLGWDFWFSSGLPCTYRTKSRDVVTKSLAAGFEIAPEARKKLGIILLSDSV